MTRLQKRLRTARETAQKHLASDLSVLPIYLLRAEDEESAKEPIKLLEVVQGTTKSGIEPVFFSARPNTGMEFPLMIDDVTPGEFRSLSKTGDVRFDQNLWTIGKELAVRSV